MAKTLIWKINPVQRQPLFLNNTMIQETSTHRHLGLTLSDSCNWKAHAKNISEKLKHVSIFLEPLNSELVEQP